MKIKILFIVFLLMCGDLCGDALASCGYEISSPSLSYVVGNANPTMPAEVSITRKKSNSSVCSNYFLAFTWGWSNNYNRRGLNLMNGNVIYYNLYKNANSTNVLRGPNDITSNNDIFAGTIEKNEKETLTYYFTLGPQYSSSPPRSGTYYDNVQVQAYSGTYTNINGYEDSSQLHIYINVAKFVSLSLVDSGGTYDGSKTSKTLDFGELTENEELNFDIRVVSNAGYNLLVSSINNGVLKRLDGAGAASQIAYDFYASNTKRTLTNSASSPVTISSYNGITPDGGSQVPVRVVIKSVSDKDPGTYQDYITLSVISNE